MQCLSISFILPSSLSNSFLVLHDSMIIIVLCIHIHVPTDLHTETNATECNLCCPYINIINSDYSWLWGLISKENWLSIYQQSLTINFFYGWSLGKISSIHTKMLTGMVWRQPYCCECNIIVVSRRHTFTEGVWIFWFLWYFHSSSMMVRGLGVEMVFLY